MIVSWRKYDERQSGNSAYFYHESKHYSGGLITHWMSLPKRGCSDPIRDAYVKGFLSACNWLDPCAEDTDSPAFLDELNRVYPRI